MVRFSLVSLKSKRASIKKKPGLHSYITHTREAEQLNSLLAYRTKKKRRESERKKQSYGQENEETFSKKTKQRLLQKGR